MACKYKYNNKWYSEEQVKKLIESEISKDDITLELLKNYSYIIEVDIAKAVQNDISDFPLDEDMGRDDVINTQYYSNLTVPGGINYTERNFETPLIKVPKSHARFNTENTIGFTRGDDRIVYTENDIDKLISIMQSSGILKIQC